LTPINGRQRRGDADPAASASGARAPAQRLDDSLLRSTIRCARRLRSCRWSDGGSDEEMVIVLRLRRRSVLAQRLDDSLLRSSIRCARRLRSCRASDRAQRAKDR
jgi:hypothetical protein